MPFAHHTSGCGYTIMIRSRFKSSRLQLLVILVIIITGLYFGRDVLIPIALSILFSFLLGPVVTRLQRYIGHVAAVLVSAIVAFAFFGSLTFFVGQQLADVASKLPEYRGNIERKALALRGAVGHVVETVKDINNDIAGHNPSTPDKNNPHAPAPVTVQSVEAPPTEFQFLQYLLGPLLGPLETAGTVIIFTIFMLIEREMLRDRLLRLVGHHEITVTTQALDEASSRISSYLLMQLVVNAVYGIGIGGALYIIGVPNAAAWGALTGFMRFIPYIGTWMAAAVPLTLSMATTQGWQPLYVFLSYLLFELTVPTFIEPVLYGSSTGMSALALLVSALFWTSLWGMPGLFLSMPLTVCLMVIGRYVPQLSFLDVLLSDHPVLYPSERYYQRLLAMNSEEASAVLEEELKHHSLVEVFDSVLFPAMVMTHRDRRLGRIDGRHELFLRETTLEITEDLIDRATRTDSGVSLGGPAAFPTNLAKLNESVIVCIPARTKDDMVAGSLAAHYLRSLKIPTESLPVARLHGHSAQVLDAASIICISALAPAAMTHARILYRRIKKRYPSKPLVICLWTSKLASQDAHKRLGCGPEDRVATSLQELSQRLTEMTSELPAPTPVPAQST